jgi:hypothetical protein
VNCEAYIADVDFLQLNVQQLVMMIINTEDNYCSFKLSSTPRDAQTQEWRLIYYMMS